MTTPSATTTASGMTVDARVRSTLVAVGHRLRTDEHGEGVISAAIVVLIMAFLGAAMWVAFNAIFSDAASNTSTQVDKIGVLSRGGPTADGPTVGVRASRPGAPRRPTSPREAGQGLVGSVAAVGVFLGFLFLAIHIVISLYATSTVTGQAYDAARRVAAAEVDHSDPGAVAAARRRAEADARHSLGRYASRVEPFDWSGSDADVVRLRIRARNPSFLAFATAPLGVEQIDRTVSVRVEGPR